MSKKGFTLVELLVSVAIFSVVVSIASAIFVSSLRTQRQNLATQQLLDQASYLMEYMSRAIRMAKKDTDASCTGKNYVIVGGCLKFKNYQGECQQFCLDNKRLKEVKDGVENYLTSPDLNVKQFNIDLSGDTAGDRLQPKVSIFLEIEGKEQSRVQFKTSVSQRDLDF